MIKWSVFSLFRNLMVIMTSVLKMFFSFYWLYKGKQLKQVKATLYTSYLSLYPLYIPCYVQSILVFILIINFESVDYIQKRKNYPDYFILFYFISFAE